MERRIVITEDGSHSIAVPQLNVMYHSIHGAIQESRHVFIDAGLNYIFNRLIHKPLQILEMGFGTGLNAFLTAIEAIGLKEKVQYTAIEQFPLMIEVTSLLNYPELLGRASLFHAIHDCQWNTPETINTYFTLNKIQANILKFSSDTHFDLIYYDAFAPNAQPELGTKDIFEKLIHLLKPRGVLVTYCSKGDVRRAMIAAGFEVKKLPGPPGKREMLRASKL